MRTFAGKARSLARSVAPRVWKIEAETGDPMCFLYLGPATQLEYITGRVLAGRPARKSCLGRRPFFTADSLISQHAATFAILAGPMSILRLQQRLADLCIPWWVDSSIFASRALQEPYSRDLRGDIKKIDKYELEYVGASHGRDLTFFYERIYLPTVTRSHGRTLLPSSLEDRKLQMQEEKCRLLFVTRGNKRVGGILVDCRYEVPVLKDVGVLDGCDEFKKMGVISAANYFAIKGLQGSGYDEIGMGASRCFVDDGVFQYKRKWRPVVTRTSDEVFLFRIPLLTPQIKSVFATFDCIVPAADGLSRVRFVDQDCVQQAEGLEDAGIYGVTGSTWYSLAGNRLARANSPDSDFARPTGQEYYDALSSANDSLSPGSKSA